MKDAWVNRITLALTCILTVSVIVWGCSMNRNKQDLEAYYTDTFKTLVHFSATWDRFMQVDEIEKRLVEMELDSIRAELNRKYDTDVWRGHVKRAQIFSTGIN